MSGYAVGHVLRTSKSSGTSLLVLIVIAEATHQDGTGAWPSVGSIAALARTSARNVSRVIGALERAGELVVERNAGPHGTNMYSIPGVGQLRLGDDTGVTPDNTSPRRQKRTPLTTATPPPLTTATGGGDIAVSPEPSSYPVVEPSKNLSRAARARGLGEIPTRLATRAELDREQHVFGKLAEDLWLDVAAKVGSPYTDRSALRLVHHNAIASLSWATEKQIFTAIRHRMDPKSTPRRIPEWARLEAADDSQREHRERIKRAPQDEVIEPHGALHHIGGAAAAVVAGMAS